MLAVAMAGALAYLTMSATPASAHTVNLCWNVSGGDVTFYMATYHNPTTPVGGVIVDDVIYNFTSVTETLPSGSACGGWLGGYDESGTNFQVVTVSGLSSGAHVLSSTCTTATECPWSGTQAFAFTGNLQTSPTGPATPPAITVPTLTVNKVVVNDDGGTADAGAFTLWVDGTDMVTNGVAEAMTVGNHAISETGPSGYASTISGDCDAGGNVTLAAGQNAVCTITNDDIPVVEVAGAVIGVENTLASDNGASVGDTVVFDIDVSLENVPSDSESEVGVEFDSSLLAYSGAEVGGTSIASNCSLYNAGLVVCSFGAQSTDFTFDVLFEALAPTASAATHATVLATTVGVAGPAVADAEILGSGVDDVPLPNLGDGSSAGSTSSYLMAGLLALVAMVLGTLGVRTAASRRTSQ